MQGRRGGGRGEKGDSNGSNGKREEERNRYMEQEYGKEQRVELCRDDEEEEEKS